MKRHLILGNGGAAISAVRAIRSINVDDEITILSKENCPAYSPVLTSYYLGGSIDYRDMFICDKSFYQQNRVKTILGKSVAEINPLLRKVYIENGGAFNYDDVLVATGSSSVVPSIEGADLPGVFALYTADDARTLIDFLETKKSVAVIGAGPIGIQALGALTNRGKNTVLVEMMDQILPQFVDRQGSVMLEERLRQKGVGIHLNDAVLGIHERRRRKVISLASGDELAVDGVILTVGVYPNVDFLQGSGIEVSKGVLIDEHCRTNTGGIYAAGDVAEALDPITGDYITNATWPSAIEQGKVAGLNMAGREVSILHTLRFNAVSVFGYPCISLGLVKEDGKDLEGVVFHDGVGYRKLFFKDNTLVGAILLGETRDAGIIATLIEKRTIVSDFCEALLRRRLFAHSVEEYYWSIFRGLQPALYSRGY